MSAVLSQAMLSMLSDVRDGLGTHGTAVRRGSYAGRYKTARALRDRGLLGMDNDLTDEGRVTLKEWEVSHGT